MTYCSPGFGSITAETSCLFPHWLLGFLIIFLYFNYQILAAVFLRCSESEKNRFGDSFNCAEFWLDWQWMRIMAPHYMIHMNTVGIDSNFGLWDTAGCISSSLCVTGPTRSLKTDDGRRGGFPPRCEGKGGVVGLKEDWPKSSGLRSPPESKIKKLAPPFCTLPLL